MQFYTIVSKFVLFLHRFLPGSQIFFPLFQIILIGFLGKLIGDWHPINTSVRGAVLSVFWTIAPAVYCGFSASFWEMSFIQAMYK